MSLFLSSRGLGQSPWTPKLIGQVKPSGRGPRAGAAMIGQRGSPAMIPTWLPSPPAALKAKQRNRRWPAEGASRVLNLNLNHTQQRLYGDAFNHSSETNSIEALLREHTLLRDVCDGRGWSNANAIPVAAPPSPLTASAPTRSVILLLWCDSSTSSHAPLLPSTPFIPNGR